MKIHFLLWTIAVFIVVKCSAPNKTVVQKPLILEDEITIKFEETLFNDKENISIKFTSLIEDSRCPVKAQCVWAGNAKVLFTVTKNSDSKNVILNTHKTYTKDTVIYDYTFSLRDVNPFPHLDSLYTEKDYSANLIISKN